MSKTNEPLTLTESLNLMSCFINHIKDELNGTHAYTTPWDSDNIAIGVKKIFHRMRKDELRVLCHQMISHGTKIEDEEACQREFDYDDFDITAFKFDASRICREQYKPKSHPIEITIIITFSIKSIAWDCGIDPFMGYNRIIATHTGSFNRNPEQLEAYCELNGLIDTAIKRQWKPENVVLAACPLIKIIADNEMCKLTMRENSTVLASDNKSSVDENEKYSKLSIITRFKKVPESFPVKDPYMIFNGFKPINALVNLTATYISTFFSAVMVDESINKSTSWLHDRGREYEKLIEELLHDPAIEKMIISDISPNYKNNVSVSINSASGLNNYELTARPNIQLNVEVIYHNTFSCFGDASLHIDVTARVYSDCIKEYLSDDGTTQRSCTVSVDTDWYYRIPDNSILTDKLYRSVFYPGLAHDDSPVLTTTTEQKEEETNMPTENKDTSLAEIIKENDNKPQYPFTLSNGLSYDYIIGSASEACGNTQPKISQLFKFPDSSDLCVCITSLRFAYTKMAPGSRGAHIDVSTHINANGFKSLEIFTLPFGFASDTMIYLMQFIIKGLHADLNLSNLRFISMPYNQDGAAIHFKFETHSEDDNPNLHNRVKDIVIELIMHMVLADHVTIAAMSKYLNIDTDQLHDRMHDTTICDMYKKLFNENFYDIIMDSQQDIL